MALGRTDISKVKSIIDDTNVCIEKYVLDELNTFKYIAKNLANWASETDVGSVTRNRINNLNKNIEDTTNGLKDLQKNLTSFVTLQEKINMGK